MNGIIIAKYELVVFDSGKIEIKQLTTQSERDDYSACSSRIRQVLSVIKEMKSLSIINNELSDIEIYTKSISNVASTLGVEQSTIADKMTRQLGKNAEAIRLIIFGYISNGSPELKELLLSKIGRNTKLEDTQSINNTLI